MSEALQVGDQSPIRNADLERCVVCHFAFDSVWHIPCRACGVCLMGRERKFTRARIYFRHRLDRLYCSNACRQRAYRKRKGAP